MDAVLDPRAMPALDGALDLLARGVASSLHADNLAMLAELDDADAAEPIASLLIDPQTAGGLLAGVPPVRADACLAELVGSGYRAAVIGCVERPRGAAAPRVRLEPGAAEAVGEPVAAG
jgi:selenide,water dikinase